MIQAADHQQTDIYPAVVRIQEQLSHDRAAMNQTLIEIRRRLEAIEHGLNGNARPGIKVRLDRLEQDHHRRDRFMWLIAGIAITAFLTRLIELI
ncbi:MAG: hypothetical protein JJU36_06430 [Phycisphaeraceae bacterium]|nr:hypothetical protein [Phycisphaeraceae bacterium]